MKLSYPCLLNLRRKSPPARGRGLKHAIKNALITADIASPPARGRGLKQARLVQAQEL